MDEICKVFDQAATQMGFFLDNGDEVDPIDGYVLHIFVPADKVEDVDRNDPNRREVTAIIIAAIEAAGG
tara:strand:+ start:214 stop:420 length:207 start_codon:yes stop_codon:yes gene_type:complete